MPHAFCRRLAVVALVLTGGYFQDWFQGTWVGVDSRGHVATVATVQCPAPASPVTAPLSVTLGGCGNDNYLSYLVLIGADGGISCGGVASLNDGVATLFPGVCDGGGTISGRLVDSADMYIVATESFLHGQVMLDGRACTLDATGALFPASQDAGVEICPTPDAGPLDAGPADGGAPDGGS